VFHPTITKMMLKRLRLPMILVHIPFLWVGGLALFPFVFCHTAHPSKRLLNHERIHLRQQIELGLVLFYVWYVLEFVLRYFIYRKAHRAYRNICFEREAYANDQNLNYLSHRKWWSFWRYL
ncbi:MAG: hypothetical protein ACK4GN_07590, partial [Runella sp.]